MTPTVEDADRLAWAAHQNQFDKAGVPLIDHPRAVAAMLAEQGHGANIIMAALLHDTVEDTAVTLQELRDRGYPAEVVDAVDALTRRPEENDYLDYVRRCARNPIGRLIKTVDVAHNSDPARLALLDEKTRARLGRKYELARVVLKEAAP